MICMYFRLHNILCFIEAVGVYKYIGIYWYIYILICVFVYIVPNRFECIDVFA